MLKCKNKIWLENITDLFCSLNVIPLSKMNLEAQLNALTRLVILVFLILLLIGFKHSVLFLLLSLLFIIILYYIQRNQMEQFNAERFTPQQSTSYAVARAITEPQNNPSVGTKNTIGLVMESPEAFRFCNDEVQFQFNDPNYMSRNQRLVGPPNPKTKIAPVVVAPSADLEYWKANNLITHSAVNEETQHDVYNSGYQVSTCCGTMIDKYYVPQNVSNCGQKYNHTSSTQKSTKQVQENFTYPYPIRNEESGQINTSCGYNPEQLLTAGLPTNYPSGNCQKNPEFKQYNNNLFTQTIQPGVYTKNQINEPINSNIGISFTQQFEPVTCTTDGTNIIYTEHDPRIIEPINEEPNLEVINAVNIYNVYDPRHSGYGTSYRSYTDDNVGQTRFFYDDINSVRMPNYITRNKIDFSPYADSYGPIPEGEANGNKFHSNIRALANDTFTRSAIQQRTELQERLMRKSNAHSWHRRMAPIRTGGQKMLGGMSCK